MKNIWISGSINSGKSTVAKILSKKLKMAVVELDSFSDFVSEFMDFEQYVKLNYELIPEIIGIYNKKNIGVIVVYPIGQDNFNSIKDKIDNVQIFTLDPSLEIALQNRGDRALNEWERGRVAHHYNIGINNLPFATRVDTRNLTPDQTANKIIDLFLG